MARHSNSEERREETNGLYKNLLSFRKRRREGRHSSLESLPSSPSLPPPFHTPTSGDSSHPDPAECSSSFPQSLSLVYGARDGRWKLFERTMARTSLLGRFHLPLHTPFDSKTYTRWAGERRRERRRDRCTHFVGRRLMGKGTEGRGWWSE